MKPFGEAGRYKCLHYVFTLRVGTFRISCKKKEYLFFLCRLVTIEHNTLAEYFPRTGNFNKYSRDILFSLPNYIVPLVEYFTN